MKTKTKTMNENEKKEVVNAVADEIAKIVGFIVLIGTAFGCMMKIAFWVAGML